MRQLTGIPAPRASGVLFVAGFAAMTAGVIFWAASQTGTSYVPPTFPARASAVFMIAGVSLTLLGLIAIDVVLWKAGDRVLSGLGTAAYGVAGVSWVTEAGRGLALHESTYDLEVVIVVAGGLSMLAFGAAVIRTGAIPRLVGWLAVGWSVAWLILFAVPHDGYPPLVPQLVPLLFGVALLRASGDRFQRPLDLPA
jgi:hypothetical protein